MGGAVGVWRTEPLDTVPVSLMSEFVPHCWQEVGSVFSESWTPTKVGLYYRFYSYSFWTEFLGAAEVERGPVWWPQYCIVAFCR